MLRLLLQVLALLDNRATILHASKGIGVPQPENHQCGLERGTNFIKPRSNPCITMETGAINCCRCMWGNSIRARNDETAERRAQYEADPEEWQKQHGNRRRHKPPEALNLKTEDPIPIEAFDAYRPLARDRSVVTPVMLQKQLVISYTCQLTVTDKEAESILPWTGFPRSPASRYAARITPKYLILCPKNYVGIKLETPSQRRYDPWDRRDETPVQMISSARCVSPEEYAQLTIDQRSPPELLALGPEVQQSESSKQAGEDPQEAAKQSLQRKQILERDHKRRMRAKLRIEATKRTQHDVTCLEIPIPQFQAQATSSADDPAIVPEGSKTTLIEYADHQEPIPTRHMQLVVGVIDSSMVDDPIEAINTALQGDGHFQNFLQPDIPMPVGEPMNAANYHSFSELDTVFDAMPQAFMSLHHTSLGALGISNTRALELNNGIRADQVVVDTALWSDIPRSDQQDHLEACFTPAFPGSLESADAYYGFQNLYLPAPKP